MKTLYTILFAVTLLFVSSTAHSSSMSNPFSLQATTNVGATTTLEIEFASATVTNGLAASGNISAVNIYATNLFGDGTGITGLTSSTETLQGILNEGNSAIISTSDVMTLTGTGTFHTAKFLHGLGVGRALHVITTSANGHAIYGEIDNAASTGNVFNIVNNGTGDGISGISTTSRLGYFDLNADVAENAVLIDTSSTTQYGLKVTSVDEAIHGVGGAWGNGVYGTSPYGNGVHGLSTSGTGVRGDGGTGKGIYGLSSADDAGYFYVKSADKGIYIWGQTPSNTQGPTLRMRHNRFGVDGDNIATIRLLGLSDNVSTTEREYGTIAIDIQDSDDTAEDSSMTLSTLRAGAKTDYIHISGATDTITFDGTGLFATQSLKIGQLQGMVGQSQTTTPMVQFGNSSGGNPNTDTTLTFDNTFAAGSPKAITAIAAGSNAYCWSSATTTTTVGVRCSATGTAFMWTAVGEVP